MKICVISDSHGYTRNIEKILENSKYNHIFFLGDGVRDFEEIDDERLTLIEGNCDLFSQYPLMTTINICNKKFMLCHGHLYNVRQGVFSLMKQAKNLKADIVCYGHTHIQNIEQIDGIYYINPGALSSNKAIEIEINDNDIKFNMIEV